jgi:hypothetical protein
MQGLGLAPEEGKAYWGEYMGMAGYALKDWNWMFIHPNTSAFSSAKSRFEAGYSFAVANEKKLSEHIFLCGNTLQIISHSQGVAFAEGLSAFFFEEKGIVTELSIHLQGMQMASTPQSRRAVNCRIVWRTTNDMVTNKRRQTLRHADVNIMEESLDGSFCKYTFDVQAQNGELVKSHLYLRGKIKTVKAHCVHRHRQFQLWTAVSHAMKLFRDTRIEALSNTENDLKLASLMHYWQNQN